MVKMVIQFPSCECAPLCTCSMVEIVLAPVVQMLDSAIQRLNNRGQEELSSLFEHQ